MDPDQSGSAETATALTALWCGLMHAAGAFELTEIGFDELIEMESVKGWFWLGEVLMAGVLAGLIAVPAGLWFAGATDPVLAIAGATVVFLPLFIFIPKLMQYAASIDAGEAIAAFGRNEHAKKVFWTLFLFLAGLVLARIVDPATAQQVVGILTGM